MRPVISQQLVHIDLRDERVQDVLESDTGNISGAVSGRRVRELYRHEPAGNLS